MTSSCKWPFSSFLLALSLLYFNHYGMHSATSLTLTKNWTCSHYKKKNWNLAFAKKLENFVITKTSKMATAFWQATISAVPFDSYPSLGHLSRAPTTSFHLVLTCLSERTYVRTYVRVYRLYGWVGKTIKRKEGVSQACIAKSTSLI